MAAKTRALLKHGQPSGGYPPGAVSFLRVLADPNATALEAWLSETRLDAEWANWLASQGLAPYAYYRLHAADLLSRLPPAVHDGLRGPYYASVAAGELHRREWALVLGALHEAGVAPIIFKGAALAYTVYPDPICRPMGDLDFWVTDEEMPRAQDALRALGYGETVKPERPPLWQLHNKNEMQFVGQRPGSGLVEPHWGVFGGEWLQRTAAIDEAGVRARAAAISLLGQPARVLAPEDAIIQLATHLAINHQFAFPWARGIIDIALLARSQAVAWGAVAERARAWRVGTVTWLVLSLAVALTGLAVESVTERLAPSPLRRWLVSALVSRESFLSLRDLSRGPRRFLLQLLLVDRTRDAARLLGRALWPETDWLALRYGRSGLGVRWRHLLGALRGRL